jgi:hypothetical protein
MHPPCEQSRPRKRLLPPSGRLLGAFLLLSLLLNIDYPADQLFSLRSLAPSPDVWLLLLGLAVAASGGRWTLLACNIAGFVLFLVLRLIRIADLVVPMYLNRPFNLYIDSKYLYGLYDLLSTSSPHGEFPRAAVIGAAIGMGMIALSWFAWRTAGRVLALAPFRRWFLGASGVVAGAALLWGGIHGRLPERIAPPAFIRLGQEIRSIRDLTERQRPFQAHLTRTAQARQDWTSSLAGLGGADVLILMIESYGRVVFTRPHYRQSIEQVMVGFSQALDRNGFEAVSSYLVSPTYGGSSWLAHGTLEGGIRIGDDHEYTALLRSSVPPLASFFRQAGYRTVSVMPGTRFAFPEGAYFGYDEAYYARHFDYRGPTFGWAPMPDQFVLDWVHRREFQKRRQPLLVRYVLISSHAAFNIQPQVIEDWATIGNGSIYRELEPVCYPIYWPDLSRAGDAYLRSLAYEFDIIGSYLARHIKDNALIILIGDHQPNRQMTDNGEDWSVPVHIISRDPALLDRFRRRGYTPGMVPSQPPPHAGMETFLQGFLEDFR